jgi:hypothetical protein
MHKAQERLSQQKPLARKEGLVIQEMPGEVLVYDLATNKAHCLNETAALVWNYCDGSNSVADITRLFGNQSGKPVEENLVWLAIDQLNENNLLAQELKADFNGQTRRDVIKKVGLAAVIALPMVSSLVAPTAALAVACSGTVTSCLSGGVPCNSGTPCTCGNGDAGTCNGSGSCIRTSNGSVC